MAGAGAGAGVGPTPGLIKVAVENADGRRVKFSIHPYRTVSELKNEAVRIGRADVTVDLLSIGYMGMELNDDDSLMSVGLTENSSRITLHLVDRSKPVCNARSPMLLQSAILSQFSSDSSATDSASFGSHGASAFSGTCPSCQSRVTLGNITLDDSGVSHLSGKQVSRRGDDDVCASQAPQLPSYEDIGFPVNTGEPAELPVINPDNLQEYNLSERPVATGINPAVSRSHQHVGLPLHRIVKAENPANPPMSVQGGVGSGLGRLESQHIASTCHFEDNTEHRETIIIDNVHEGERSISPTSMWSESAGPWTVSATPTHLDPSAFPANKYELGLSELFLMAMLDSCDLFTPSDASEKLAELADFCDKMTSQRMWEEIPQLGFGNDAPLAFTELMKDPIIFSINQWRQVLCWAAEQPESAFPIRKGILHNRAWTDAPNHIREYLQQLKCNHAAGLRDEAPTSSGSIQGKIIPILIQPKLFQDMFSGSSMLSGLTSISDNKQHPKPLLSGSGAREEHVREITGHQAENSPPVLPSVRYAKQLHEMETNLGLKDRKKNIAALEMFDGDPDQMTKACNFLLNSTE